MRSPENFGARQWPRRVGMRGSIGWAVERKHRLLDDRVVARLVKIVVGAETKICVLLLGR